MFGEWSLGLGCRAPSPGCWIKRNSWEVRCAEQIRIAGLGWRRKSPSSCSADFHISTFFPPRETCWKKLQVERFGEKYPLPVCWACFPFSLICNRWRTDPSGWIAPKVSAENPRLCLTVNYQWNVIPRREYGKAHPCFACPGLSGQRKPPLFFQRKRVNFSLSSCLKSRQLSRAPWRASTAQVGMKGLDQPIVRCGQWRPGQCGPSGCWRAHG